MGQFKFGLEAEFMLVDAVSFRPLWHEDCTFSELNGALESIKIEDLPGLDGLELEPPHRKMMPYAVEGFHVSDENNQPIDLMPKGVEVRTPVCSSISECLSNLKILFERMQESLSNIGYRAAIISHHPIASKFEGPQYKRRYDFWRWAKEAMTTYGPDVNISVPEEMRGQIDDEDLHSKVNFYGPALAALTLDSPFCQGDLWKVRGKIGKSLRTHKRSVFGQILELHPEEDGRMELKPFEMSTDLRDFEAYFLLWLELILDRELCGRASYQSRIYDLGAIARDGLEHPTVLSRASEVIERAYMVLPEYGFDPSALARMAQRIDHRRLPADDLIEQFQSGIRIEEILRKRTELKGDSPLAISQSGKASIIAQEI